MIEFSKDERELSKCCKHPTYLGCNWDKKHKEIVTMYHICLKCKEPCDVIKYIEK